MPPPLQRRLYHSQLSTREHLKSMGKLAQEGRVFSAAHGISGLLIFDGLRFCEYLEGPAPALGELMERIERDPRHMGLVHVIDSALPGARLFQGWSLAYAMDEDAEPLQAIEALSGEPALAYFMSLVPQLDMA